MYLVLADLQWTTCLVYLDDIIVFGRSFQEHLSRLGEVLAKLKAANLKVKPSKCDLFSSCVKYLGHVISVEGIMAAKVEAVREWPTPKTQSYLGLASYYSWFVRGFADIARPLHQLTEKGRRFRWGEECQVAFNQLKATLITAPVLSYPDPNKTFILDTDASDVGVGAVLSQEEGGLERVIAYASQALTKEERKYATTKKELLAMVTFTKYFKHFFLGKEFVLHTDHNSLRWLHNFQGLEGQLARWVEQLASFHYKIVHRPGKQHGNADALSRLPAYLGAKEEGSIGLIQRPIISVCAVRKGPQVEQGEGNVGEGDDLAQAQRDDPELALLIHLKQVSDDNSVEIQQNAALKKYSSVWGQLQLQDQRLVRVPPPYSDAASKVQVVLSKVLVASVLNQLHSSVTGGHLGIQKLQETVRDRF